MDRPTILTFVPHYLPGYKAGGPIRTIANIVEHLGEEYQFRIVTSDRDTLDSVPYTGINANTWVQVGKACVYYLSPKARSLSNLCKLIKNTRHDLLYLNSFFFPDYAIKPLILRHLGLLPDRPVILAPRGEFSEGALKLKRIKKTAYLLASQLAGVYHDLIWQASNEHEADDIRKVLGNDLYIQVAPNLPPAISTSAHNWPEKEENSLRILFLSRISPMKNLHYAIRIIRNILYEISFTIAGPVNDNRYWSRCKNLLEDLPQNIKVRYIGSIEHEKVCGIMSMYDLFFLPTAGENYGHVIGEAISTGTPALISDQTPWHGLERAGVGWEVPLAQPEQFREIIDYCSAMGPEDYHTWREYILDWGRQKEQNSQVVEKTRALFRVGLQNCKVAKTAGI